MLSRLNDWLDLRTGYKKFVGVMLLEHVPGGAKWRYVWGSMLAFAFSIQLFTGILLMMAYSPGDSTAWGSVYFIQYEMEFGWLIRGLHHFGSQAMVVLLACHLLQVVIAGAQLKPREVNWWLGLALLGAVLGLSLTGYLLPWDQKGYWATGVATNIAGSLPGPGDFIKRVLVGGPEYGNATLTRFYALHVGVLPLTVIVLLVLHIAVFRRHGVTAPKHSKGADIFWPDQAFKDMAACMVLFALLLAVVIWGGQGNVLKMASPDDGNNALYEKAAFGGRDGRGANLDAPADPGSAYPARPEWYFLFLFQLLKYFEGDEYKLIGTVVIPNGVAVLLFLLPLFGYGRMRPLGHMLGVVVVVGVLAGAGTLTSLALADDMEDPVSRQFLNMLGLIAVPVIAGVLLIQVGLMALLPPGRFRRVVYGGGVLVLLVLVGLVGSGVYGAMTGTLPDQLREQVAREVVMDDATRKKTADIHEFRKQMERAEHNAARAVQLAHAGIPDAGAIALLQRDPMTAGKRLFGERCASCHRFGNDYSSPPSDDGKPAKGSDLGNFGSKQWILDFLQNPADRRFFGGCGLEGMKKWSKDMHEAREKLSADKQAEFDAWLDRVATWLVSKPTQKEPEDNDQSNFAKGYRAFNDVSKKKLYCANCHSYRDSSGSAPDLTGYGSQEWIRLMIMAPGSSLRHGDKNEMPPFRNDQGPGAEVYLLEAKKAGSLQPADIPVATLSDVERELIIRYITRDDRLVFFGRPIAGPENGKKSN